MTDAWFLRDGLPMWLAALSLAAVAPWCVRFLAAALERRTVRRTRDLTSSIVSDADAAGTEEQSIGGKG